ncbi:MAG TPA: nucleotidyltransferase [Agrobacterium sp.]|uniref:SMODS domain-containing nucleotidyltransferase n=1 Tax=Agrobacterium pusense TaxID=648995 RepID=UPI000E8703D3|nr:nucleotidyltransferase [Agrobacterium pusense]MDH1271659.1 nucleotidyltransferase [Agrobacterium pusense]HAU76573.1 nucleotidyltransferase [Agrobacterium sp.]
MAVPNARFTEFLADIEPSATTKTNSSKAHTAVRDHLKAHETFGAKVERDFLSGSYARNTSIRPKVGADGVVRPDVDIIIVTNYTTVDTPDDVLSDLCEALEDAYTVERINRRSIKLITPNAEMDVVPVIDWGLQYKIPDRETGEWRLTDPPGHIEWSRDRNEEFGGRLKPLVKLFKWWRRENNSGKRPKGFVLEVLAAKHAPQSEIHYGEAFAKMLENIHAQYAFEADLGNKPFIEDPSVIGSDILSKVTVAQWQAFIAKVKTYADYARKAQSAENMEDATWYWRKVFGSRFPATMNATAAKSSSLLEKASATAGTTAYVFPNAMAAPSKPRGFA